MSYWWYNGAVADALLVSLTGKTSTLENGILLLLFNNTDLPFSVGSATVLRGSAVAGSLYVSLHTSDPGEAGSQTTSEISYTSYARVAVARSSSGWTVTNNVVNPTSNIVFPKSTGGSATATHYGIGTDSSGTGMLLYFGPLTKNILCSEGITPIITTDTTITEN